MTQTTDHLKSDFVSSFIDGELSTNESQAIQQHIADCHICALQVVSATQLKPRPRAGQRFATPLDALARLTAQVQQQSPKKSARILSFRSAAWVGVAASLVLAILLRAWQQARQANALYAELLDQHLTALSSGASPEVTSTDRHTVKPWFHGKLPFSFNLPNSLHAGTILKGGVSLTSTDNLLRYCSSLGGSPIQS